MDWQWFKGANEGAFKLFFSLSTTTTYIIDRFILLRLPATYRQQWSSVYQHSWISVTYSGETQLLPVPLQLLKPSSSDFMNFARSLSLKVFASWFLYHASMRSLIISPWLPCLGPPMAYARQSQNQSISKLWKSLGAGRADSGHSSRCYRQLPVGKAGRFMVPILTWKVAPWQHSGSLRFKSVWRKSA